MTYRFQLEDGSGYLLLEDDGQGYLLLENAPPNSISAIRVDSVTHGIIYVTVQNSGSG